LKPTGKCLLRKSEKGKSGMENSHAAAPKKRPPGVVGCGWEKSREE